MSHMRRKMGIPKNTKPRIDKRTPFGRQIVHRPVELVPGAPITHVDIYHATNGWRRIRVLDPGRRRRLIGI